MSEKMSAQLPQVPESRQALFSDVRSHCPNDGHLLSRERGEGTDEIYCEFCGFSGGTTE